tara:strand:- start:133 stop:606 length:474 start_codon:yes stop_codon:yes gene_type:complete
MILSHNLRQLIISDHRTVRDVYVDAIQSQVNKIYSQEQVNAWSALAYLPQILDKPLKEGKGFVSCQNNQIEAFAVRYPMNRLALLYCRGRSTRLGHASNLLDRIELEAKLDKQNYLVTEASLCSFELLLKRGWILKNPEKILIGGVDFTRYLMKKYL